MTTRISESDALRLSEKNRLAQSGTAFDLYLPIATISEANGRQHWAVKARRVKIHRQQAYLLTQALKSLRLPATIKLVRVSPRILDGDNLQSALKATRDGIADRLGIDDRDPRVTWQYGQRQGNPKQKGVEVEARHIPT